MTIDRRASLAQSRRVVVLAYVLKISLGGSIVFVSTAASVLAYVAFGPFKITRVRRVR